MKDVHQMGLLLGSPVAAIIIGLVLNVLLHAYQGWQSQPYHALFFSLEVGLLYSPLGLAASMGAHAVADSFPILMLKRNQRSRRRRLAVLACVGFALTAPLAAEDFFLAVDGQPRAEIRIAEGVDSGPLLFAAQELERYVKALSGASLPVVRSTEGNAAAPGAVVLTADPPAPRAAGAGTPSPVGEDRYRLVVSDKRITLHGATPRAALFATYDLLERLGCSWCVPGDDTISGNDTVPKRSTLSISAFELNTTAAFQYRMMLDFPLMSAAQSIAIVDWIAKNRMNWVHPCPNAMGEPVKWYERREALLPEIRKRGLHVIFGGHTMHTWVPPESFAAHPEWFAYVNGERKAPTLCVASHAMTETLIRNLQAFLDRCPEVEVVDLWHPDEEVSCLCPGCTQGLVPAAANGKIPDGVPADSLKSAYVTSYVQFMNRVAAAVAKSHPRVLLSPLIYGPTDHAFPDGCPPLADNLLAGLAHIARDSYRPLAGEHASPVNLRFLGNDLSWMAKSRHHYIYEYYNSWLPPYVYPGAQVIVRDLQILKTLGSQGASSDMYGYSPCNMYVAARALWSPDISWEAAVRDFHLRYYREAGREMADNWIELEKGVYGKAGYQSGGALGDPSKRAAAGEWLNEVRPRQIELLEKLIARAESSLVRARLERALLPWKQWSAEPRWWAFPPFETR